MKLIIPCFLLISACTAQSGSTENQECNSPDAPVACSFAALPARLDSHAVITDGSSGGERLYVSGRILDKEGNPVAGAIIYIYHTDEKGIYSRSGKETGVQKWHGKHHGWCKTGKNGTYSFQTIRPASYPNSTAPQHIHAAVKLPGGQISWISDFLFSDDPNLGKEAPPAGMAGGNGVMKTYRDKEGGWAAERIIYL